MDARSARRAAEKAARDLVTARAAVVGDLGVTSAERAARAATVATAAAATAAATATATATATAEQGEELVCAAREQAARLVAAAQQDADAAAGRYADAHSRALSAGWSANDLTALGFPPATAAQRRRAPAAVAPAQRSAPRRTPPAGGTASDPARVG